MASSATLLRRRLARELARLRREAKLGSSDAAAAADLSQASLSRVENAVVHIKANTVKALLEAYGVDGAERAALIALAREASLPGWWLEHGVPLSSWHEVYLDAESQAHQLTTYETQFVPDLLQTPEYARGVLRAARPDEGGDALERRVALRMARQRRLLGGELRVRVVADEWVLRRPYGGVQVLRAQLDRLQRLGRLEQVSLRVLPMAAEPAVTGTFTILDFPVPADPAVAYVGYELGSDYQEDPARVGGYREVFERLLGHALERDASLELIREIEHGLDS